MMLDQSLFVLLPWKEYLLHPFTAPIVTPYFTCTLSTLFLTVAMTWLIFNALKVLGQMAWERTFSNHNISHNSGEKAKSSNLFLNDSETSFFAYMFSNNQLVDNFEKKTTNDGPDISVIQDTSQALEGKNHHK